MLTLFDSLQDSVFSITHNVFGYNASWTSNDNVIRNARILFKHPSDDDKLQNVNYSKIMYELEYKYSDWEGLKESVDSHNTESIEIENIGSFSVRKVTRHFDGKTYKAILVKNEA